MRKAKNTVSGVTCTKCGGTNIITAELIFSGGKYKQQYKCRDCGRRFFDPNEIKYKKSDIIKEGLNQIRLNKNTDQVKYICPYCENILDYDEEEKLYYCKECETSFDKINSLQKVDYIYLAKKSREVQRKRDELRIQNKILREEQRKLNAMEDFGKALYKVFKDHSADFKVIDHKPKNENIGGIIQFSDAHFNELVLAIDNVGNEFDFEIASKRCYSYIQDAMTVFSAFNVKTVWFAMLGDMINSDRRPEEMIMKATSRANAYFIAVELIEQMILQLNTKYNVYVSGVSGNESRFDIDYSSSNIKLQDNFDYMIYQQMKIDFEDKSGIEFLDINIKGEVINFFGKRILVQHGMTLKSNDSQKEIQMQNGKWTFKGQPFDYMLTGHFHSTKITDLYSRNSSVVGGNSYSDDGLNLFSKAAQNIHLVNPKFIHSMKIDLQDNFDDNHYSYRKSLEAYDRKSLDKLKQPKKIIEIY